MSAELIRELSVGMQLAYDAICMGFTDEALLHIGHHIAKADAYLATPPPQPSVSEGSVPEFQAMVLLLRAALAEAMDWNWLDDDARPSGTATFCDAAMRSVDAALAAAPQPTTKKG